MVLWMFELAKISSISCKKLSSPASPAEGRGGSGGAGGGMAAHRSTAPGSSSCNTKSGAKELKKLQKNPSLGSYFDIQHSI